MDVNGFVPKEVPIAAQPLSPSLNGKPTMPYNSMIHTSNLVPLPVVAPTLNNNINPNNALHSARDELPWPKLIVSICATFLSRLIIHLVP